MARLLEVNNLAVSYHTYAGEVQSVRGVSFTLDEHETMAIVGESGCGKSVTSKSIMGLIQCPPGEIKEGSEIIYLGKNLLEQSEKEWQDYRGNECSMIFQDALSSLNPTMEIGKQIMENITNHEDVSKEEARKRAIEMLELVKIPDAEAQMKKYPFEMSGGMRQRVMIAIALSGNPKILIADEPTTALDVTIQAQIMDLLKDMQDRLGVAIILITHDLGVVANVAKNIVVMYSGMVMERGNSDQIFFEHKHPYTWALLNSAPTLELSASKNVLEPIEGTPPDLIDPPKGCPFAARCKYCMNCCVDERPPEFDLGDGHKCACWRYDPESPFKNDELTKEAK